MSDKADAKALMTRVSELIDSSIGLDVFLARKLVSVGDQTSDHTKENCYSDGIRMVAIYVAIFVFIPWLINYLANGPWFGSGTGLLYALQLYGGLWAGLATPTTGLASRALTGTLNH